MKIHFHRWRYFSSKHRICRTCGEPQHYKPNSICGWYTDNFDSWAKAYPIQQKTDQQEHINGEETALGLESWLEEQKTKGKTFLLSIQSK